MLWVIFGKPNRARFHKEQSTDTGKISETLPLTRSRRSVFRIPQYGMNLHLNTANEYLNHLFVHLHD